MWKTLIRPAMIFIPLTLGVLCPQAHVLNDPPVNWVRWTLTIMLFLSFLQVRFSDLGPRREHWRLLAANLAMGIVPYALLRWLIPAHPELAQAAFFIGITPTAAAAPVVMAFLNGRIAFVLTGFTISSICISASLLILLPWVTGSFTASFIGGVLQTLLLVIALPLSLATLVRKIWPGSKDLSKKLKTFSFLLWASNLFVLASVARQYFIENPGTPLWIVLVIAAASIVFCVCNFALGSLLGPKKLRRECSQLLGQKNTTFTMYLALHFSGALVAMGPIFYIVCHNVWNAYQMYQYDKHRSARKNRAGKIIRGNG